MSVFHFLFPPVVTIQYRLLFSSFFWNRIPTQNCGATLDAVTSAEEDTRSLQNHLIYTLCPFYFFFFFIFPSFTTMHLSLYIFILPSCLNYNYLLFKKKLSLLMPSSKGENSTSSCLVAIGRNWKNIKTRRKVVTRQEKTEKDLRRCLEAIKREHASTTGKKKMKRKVVQHRETWVCSYMGGKKKRFFFYIYFKTEQKKKETRRKR